MHARREEGLARSVAPPLLSVPVPSPSPLVHLGAAVEAESRRERVRESERAANLEPPRPVTSSPSLPSGATGDGLPRNYAAIAGKTLPPSLPPKTAAESSVLASRMLMCDHLHPPDPYNQIVEAQLCETGFYYVSQIGVIKGQSAMINALIERWRPETHTFHFPVGECAVTLEDVAVILGLPTNGLPVTGPTMSSFEALEAECLHQFGIAPSKNECRGSFIKLTWFRGVRDRIVLNDVHMQMYVKCHIMLLFGKVLFADKSGAGVHWKFLPLFRNFGGIIQFSWGSACLAHLYRSLCRATRVDCKEMDGPLTLLVSWAWIRLPFLAPIPGNPRVFPIANRWHNWDRQNYAYRYKTLAHYRRLLDDLEEGQFVWQAYGIGYIDPDVIPLAIRHNSVVWSAIVPLISFECIE
ncbi:serine/threonine-protein phosphatase 7 long form homolog [Arachis hypogaea]|uniref:serine/threonine-protein phosphatase 7 long form homolog n=1 Tax=Arachis hypogaea TaxID=3818 RepID=UPI000DED2AFF|nr:serine/threonine-protein phosphatase 7 long form homolog isoform X1 [Arachis hypogaea]